VPLAKDPSRESTDDKDGEAAAETLGVLGDRFNLFAEDVAGAENGESPEKGAEAVIEKKFARAHVKDAGERRGDGVENGNEFGDEQRTSALFGEKAFGAADTGIRLQRNFAEELQDADAFDFTERVPNAVSGDGGDSDED